MIAPFVSPLTSFPASRDLRRLSTRLPTRLTVDQESPGWPQKAACGSSPGGATESAASALSMSALSIWLRWSSLVAQILPSSPAPHCS